MAKRKSVKKAAKTKAVKAVKNEVTHTSLKAEQNTRYDENKDFIKERGLPIKRNKTNFVSIEHGVRINKAQAKMITDEKRKPAPEAKSARKPRARAAKAEVQASA